MFLRWMLPALRAALLIAVAGLTAAVPPAPQPSLEQLIGERVRYVFVIYQENRSFDHYFGTFPGANGIYSSAARTHGFSQYNPVAQRQTPRSASSNPISGS